MPPAGPVSHENEMRKPIPVAFLVATLLAMTSCQHQSNGRLEIQTFDAVVNPVPYNTAPTLKGAWTYKQSPGGGKGLIVASDSPWQEQVYSSPFEISAERITASTTYTLTIRADMFTKAEVIRAKKTTTCTVDVTPQSTTVALPFGDYLVVGGAKGEGLQEATVKVERWNAIEGWRLTAPLHAARKSPVVTSLSDGQVLVSGGKDADGNPVPTEETYDPALEQWTIR